jgi:MoxR-like ATPase
MSTSKPGQRDAYQRMRGLEKAANAERQAEKSIDTSKIDELFSALDAVLGGNEVEESPSTSKDTSQKARELASQLGTEEEVQTLAKEAFSVLRSFMEKRQAVLDIQGKLSQAIEVLIRQAHQSSEKESVHLWKMIATYEAKMAETKGVLDALAEQNPIAFQAHWLLKIREQKKQFEESGIIETDAIREQTEQLMDDVRRKLEGTNGVVALLGPTGSGKSVMARKIASKFSAGGEYEFVSAHPKMAVDDLIERMGIVVQNASPSEVPDLVEQAQSQFKLENPELDTVEMRKNLKIIEEVVTKRESQKVLETRKILEAVGRAAKEGRMVVIDEFNYLPPDTLAALNDLISGGKNTKEGFGIIFTGNIGKEYIKRQSLDPAFVNRVLSGTVEYGFPPQELDRSFADSVVSRDGLEEGKEPPSRDLYQIALEQLLDAKGNLQAPEQTLEQVWDLSRVIALTQQLAGGKDFRDLGLAGAATQGVTAFKFENVFLSFRNLNQVVREWKLDGFTKPLEWYVFANIIRPASVISSKEAAQLFYLFQSWGGMFEGKSWKPVEVDTTTWGIAGVKDVKTVKAQDVPLRTYLPSEVVEAFSGKALPSYDTLDSSEAVVESHQEQSNEKEIARMEQEETELRVEFEKEPNIVELCAMLTAA